jgi:hypothetical protein
MWLYCYIYKTDSALMAAKKLYIVIPDHAFIRNQVDPWNRVSSCELSLYLLKEPERIEMERHVLFTFPIIYSSNTIKGSVLSESYTRTLLRSF